MDCSVVIVSYNTFTITREAVSSALRCAGNVSCEVIVVDNASPDASASRLEQTFRSEVDRGDVTVIANAHNAGFSAANNQGAHAARGDTLLFFNPDTVTHQGAIEVLHRYLHANPAVGIAAPRVLNTDGSNQSSIIEWPTVAGLLRYHFPLSDLLHGHLVTEVRVPDRSGPVDAAKGCALAMRKEAFDAVGGWDERIFMYAEENALCKAAADIGLATHFVPQAVITHHGEVSTSDTPEYYQVMSARNADAFLEDAFSPFRPAEPHTRRRRLRRPGRPICRPSPAQRRSSALPTSARRASALLVVPAEPRTSPTLLTVGVGKRLRLVGTRLSESDSSTLCAAPHRLGHR